MSKTETISIPKEEYEELIRCKYESSISKNIDKFNFDEVFGIGNKRLNAQKIKNMLREEW